MDLGGALWIIIDIVFVAMLAGALAFGAFQWHRIKDDRRRRLRRDAATRENYEEGG
jgi:hypothetical protein